MRPAVISGCSATALAIGGWALPIVFPHVDPTVAKYMLWLAAFLLLTAVALWLWGRNRGPLDGGLTQSSSGDGPTNVAGPNATVNVYHGQSSPAEKKASNYSLDNIDALGRVLQGAAPPMPQRDGFREAVEQAKYEFWTRKREPKRDIGLAEALAYAELKEWGRSFFEAASSEKNVANEHLSRFRQLAHDGLLTVWGKRSENGVFQIIPKEHWLDHNLEWFDLLRGNSRTENVSRTEPHPYSEIMVCKAEFEWEWCNA